MRAAYRKPTFFSLILAGLIYNTYKIHEINNLILPIVLFFDILLIFIWMQKVPIWHLGKIRYSVDFEASGKNTQLKIQVKFEVKIILFLWKGKDA